MVDKTAVWAVFVGLVSLFLFSSWAAYAYFLNPAEIPMEPIVMAVIALLTTIGAWFFRVTSESKRKNINTSPVKSGGSVTIGDSGTGSDDYAFKNINSGKIDAQGDVRIGDGR